jgi:hypothetical protein
MKESPSVCAAQFHVDDHRALSFSVDFSFPPSADVGPKRDNRVKSKTLRSHAVACAVAKIRQLVSGTGLAHSSGDFRITLGAKSIQRGMYHGYLERNE